MIPAGIKKMGAIKKMISKQRIHYNSIAGNKKNKGRVKRLIK